MKSTLRCGLVLAAALAVVSSLGLAQEQRDSRDPLLNQGPKAVATAENAMVATQLPNVTQAALRVLEDGGNAADAFVTAVFLQHVEDTHQVSHFGAMSGLYYEASSGTTYAFNAFSERPRADRCGDGKRVGRLAIGGTVRGLESLAERFGTKPWASYLEPAIAAAEQGVVVTNFQYANNYSLWENGDLIRETKRRAPITCRKATWSRWAESGRCRRWPARCALSRSTAPTTSTRASGRRNSSNRRRGAASA